MILRQTDYVILGLLAEQPLSGYQIKKIVDIRFQFFWSESFGQIFPALKSLALAGLVEECPPEHQDGRAVKRRLKIGQQSGTVAELLDGAREGEQVIAHPDDRLREGVRVETR